MTENHQCDIAIVGAGPAGLIAAATLATTGRSICLIDPSNPAQPNDEADRDLRSTAFLHHSCDLFARIGIWDKLKPVSHRLRALRIVDLSETPLTIREQKTFEPQDLDLEEFGWNILNWQLRDALVQHISGLPNVTMMFNCGLTGLITRSDMARLTLSNGARVVCKLAIAADGRNSTLRAAAGIEVDVTRYGQKSIAFSALHDVPHNDISTEIYQKGGPFTMVPLGKIDGRFASAVVWMNEGPYAHDLLHMPVPDFEKSMTTRTAELFGPLSLASARGMFPIITQKARQFSAQRVAMIAEAAHVLPPIGAQGLNTSVGDIAALFQLISSQNDPGSQDLLDEYSDSRAADVQLRSRAIDLFNRVTRSQNSALQSLRMNGLRAAYHIAPLRKGLMRAGLGPG